MQMRISRHGFANASLAILLAISWAWTIAGDLATVNAASEQDGAAAKAAPAETQESTTRPSLQGTDVQAPAGPADQTELPATHQFVATAYSIKGLTASGVQVRSGIIAADPRILPIGSIVRVMAGKYSGIYTVLDTGLLITGRKIDIYIPSYKEAVNFGRKKVKLQILRYGWNPNEDGAMVAKMLP